MYQLMLVSMFILLLLLLNIGDAIFWWLFMLSIRTLYVCSGSSSKGRVSDKTKYLWVVSEWILRQK